jgi:hypothetical protein
MLKRFVGVWILYWLLVALLPVSSIYQATNAALLLQLSFVLLVVVSLAPILAPCGLWRVPVISADIPHASRLMWTAIVLSVIGAAALAYDKIAIQGIDFSQGLGAARQQWGHIAAARHGRPSSIFSVVGYLTGSTYYVATILAASQVRSISAPHASAGLAFSFLLALANSALTSGRSSLLLWAVFLIVALSIRPRNTSQHDRARPLPMALTALTLAAAFGYVLFVFYQRASYLNARPTQYVLQFLPFLGLSPAPWYAAWAKDACLGDLSAVVVLAASYISHSFATVAAILGAPTNEKAVLFVHVLDMMSRLGLVAPPDSGWFLAGRMPSVPGALWHQFGPAGFVVGSLCIGAVCALARIWYAQYPSQLLSLGAYSAAESILLLTPAVFAVDLLSFPFAVLGLVILAAAQTLWQRRARRALKPGSQPL